MLGDIDTLNALAALMAGSWRTGVMFGVIDWVVHRDSVNRMAKIVKWRKSPSALKIGGVLKYR